MGGRHHPFPQRAGLANLETERSLLFLETSMSSERGFLAGGVCWSRNSLNSERALEDHRDQRETAMLPPFSA